MANENVLVERDFTIPHGGVNYEIKAKAMFITHEVAPIERGEYRLSFASRGKDVDSPYKLDKTLYTRERAREVAESAFASGEIERYVKNQIQTWINIGSL